MRGVLFEGFHGGPAASGFASLPSATFRWSEFYKSREIISEARRLILVSTGNLDWKWWEGLPFKNSNPRDFFCWMFFFFCKNGWTIKWERNPWWVFGCSVDLPSSFKLPQGGGVYTPLQCLHSSWIHPHRFCSRHEPRSCAAPKLKRFSCEWLDAVGAMGTLGVM